MGRDGELSGIDTEGIKSSLSSWFSFRRLMESGILTEAQVEQIIERITCTAEQPRLFRWLGDTFPQLSEEDRLYLSRLKFKDFGRLSRRFLCDLEGQVKDTGEVFTIMQAMWETNNTLMQLLSDKYTFMDAVRKENDIFYRENPHTLENRMDDLYLSNAVRRPIYQTLEIVKDVIHAIVKVKRDEEKARLNEAISRISKLRQGVYEDYKDGILSKEDYLTYQLDYETKEKQLKAQLAQAEMINDSEDIIKKAWISKLIKNGKLESLDRTTVVETIERINVYEDGHIEIRYKFSDELSHLFKE